MQHDQIEHSAADEINPIPINRLATLLAPLLYFYLFGIAAWWRDFAKLPGSYFDIPLYITDIVLFLMLLIVGIDILQNRRFGRLWPQNQTWIKASFLAIISLQLITAIRLFFDLAAYGSQAVRDSAIVVYLMFIPLAYYLAPAISLSKCLWSIFLGIWAAILSWYVVNYLLGIPITFLRPIPNSSIVGLPLTAVLLWYSRWRNFGQAAAALLAVAFFFLVLGKRTFLLGSILSILFVLALSKNYAHNIPRLAVAFSLSFVFAIGLYNLPKTVTPAYKDIKILTGSLSEKTISSVNVLIEEAISSADALVDQTISSAYSLVDEAISSADALVDKVASTVGVYLFNTDDTSNGNTTDLAALDPINLEADKHTVPETIEIHPRDRAEYSATTAKSDAKPGPKTSGKVHNAISAEVATEISTIDTTVVAAKFLKEESKTDKKVVPTETVRNDSMRNPVLVPTATPAPSITREELVTEIGTVNATITAFEEEPTVDKNSNPIETAKNDSITVSVITPGLPIANEDIATTTKATAATEQKISKMDIVEKQPAMPRRKLTQFRLLHAEDTVGLGMMSWRLHLWKNAFNNILEKPWFGWGFGPWVVKHEPHRELTPETFISGPHNGYLTVVFRLGVFLAAVFFAVPAIFLTKLISERRSLQPIELLTASVIFYSYFNAMFNIGFESPQDSVPAYLLLGLLGYNLSSKHSRNHTHLTRSL